MTSKLFFLVFARDGSLVHQKVEELQRLRVSYVVVCGEKTPDDKVVYREPRGKYDAINFGFRFVPKDKDILALHDVDAKIYGLENMLDHFSSERVGLVYAKPLVYEGPQVAFYKILNAIRSRLPIASSGELMLVRREVLEHVLPLRPCKAEDSYILFSVLGRGYKAVFCRSCLVETHRTKRNEAEEDYKRINVAGIYQALTYARPPILVRVFYLLLPLMAPLLLVLGKKGYFWSRGILLGFFDYLRGDRSGSWQPTYME